MKLLNTVMKKFAQNYKTKEIKLYNWQLGRLKWYNKPSMEEGAREVVENVFPKFKGKISSKIDINYGLIQGKDKLTLDVFQREKPSTFLDNENFDKSVHFMRSKINPRYKFWFNTNWMESYNVLPNDTSSCYPNYRPKGCDREKEFVGKQITTFFKIDNIEKMFSYLSGFPATIFHRFTPKLKEHKSIYKVEYKIRQIFGITSFICCLEVILFGPFVEAFKAGLREFHTIGLTRFQVSSRVANLRRKARNSNGKVICGDISGCDMSIPPYLHMLFVSHILEKVNNPKLIKSIIALGKYLTYTPIFNSDGQIVRSCGSNKSGSWTTTVLNTYCVMLALTDAFITIVGRPPVDGEILVQGDDFIMVLPKESDKITVKRILLTYNLRIKPLTSDIVKPHEDIEFLGFYWDNSNSPWAKEEWIVARILFPERRIEQDGPDRIISRYLSLIFLLRNSTYLFKRFLDADKHLMIRFRFDDFKFKIVTLDGKSVYNNIPVRTFLQEGWKLT